MRGRNPWDDPTPGKSDEIIESIVSLLHNKTLRHRVLPWVLLILLVAFIFNAGMIIVQGNLLPFSQGNAEHHEHSEFALRVGDTGKTVYTKVPEGALKGTAAISSDLARELLSTTYPDPETATEAATHEELAGNPAFAHAVNVCTHSSGKVSHQTGSGRHLTWFRFHDGGRHYTRTAHQVLTQSGYQTTDTFSYSVSRNFCGC